MKKLLAILLVYCAISLPSIAQTGIITGKVTGEKGESLPGVSVQIKNTNKGTSTDTDGNFRLDAGNTDVILIFRLVGYLTTEVNTSGKSSITVTLKQDTRNLDQVVVTALGISRKERAVGYSVQEVKGSNLTLTKEQNVLGSLAGKIAGVQVVGSSGASMGGTQKIKLRGINSINGQEEPLIVVDGTPISNNNFAGRNGPDLGNLAQDVNPEDIESVNVLKGPAASALYGLRGQYGVILITTRQGGRKGNRKVAVDVNSAFSVEKAGNFMPLQNIYGAGSSQQFSTITVNGQSQLVASGTDESWGPKMDGTPVRQMYSFYPADPDYGKLTPFSPHPDNIKDYFVTGTTFNNNISMSGGGENTTFRLSFNHTDIKGIEPNTYLKRNNLGFNGSLNLTPKLTVSTSFNYANNKGQRPAQGYYQGSRNFYQWFERSLDMNRLKQYKYPDGTFYHWNHEDIDDPDFLKKPGSDWNNPYFEAYENLNHDTRDRFFGNVGLSYDVLPGLKVSGAVRGDMYTQSIDQRKAYGGRDINEYYEAKFENKEMNYEILAQYNKAFDKLSLNANVGGNLLTQRYNGIQGRTQGGLSVVNFYNLSASIDRPNVSNYLRRKEVRSAFAAVSLGYDNIYYLDATVRNDISSALPAGNNSYWYPSVSFSMVFSELLKWEPLSYGKVRLSFAKAGSDLDPYQIYESYILETPYKGRDDNTYLPMHLPTTLNNPGIRPSLGNSFETGLDLKVLNNRLGLAFTYYNQQNIDQVLSIPVSGAIGYENTIINAGKIQNKGVELSLNGTPVQTKFFNWSSTLNVSRNRSLVKELYPGINTLQLDVNTYSRVSVYLNADVNAAFGTLVGNAYRRDTKTGKILLDAANLPMFEENHNFGSVVPDFTGGWLNTFRIGRFDVSAMIDFQSGGQFFSWTKMLSVKSGQAEETAAINDKGKNVRDPLADGGGVKVNGISSVTGAEVTAYVDAKSYYRTVLGTSVYEEWLYDASYIKMRELRVGYTFTREVHKKMPFNSINVALIARNPFMIYQQAPKGLDPSELSTGRSSISWLETGQLATTRSFGINLNISL
ncbi:SusC/RagA family TonB-linked outer membrane protein [Chitinophaga ginsengisegetis]|uniref:SusC/RagA family TonB-linked outer membrane protein n=1 Tax=Chitinophaga ginsengisegetis TaxID=393003 RepID=UPI000DB99845|nr:SusC/RagA family TonB-linked outer membrane protein [Chitinophaga ginsengisegetis]MDR6566932.1 TonB-linked SusC/RagA family outer membrane protein [Chitinophaga ginsengisegetis]MDR6646662.1 TonB-linked SusC/RagA family outer membrane protein [Chitinophaga ginsengisegetis]MDR6653012.1 TonB-linked SusC/RagA family outer membrane protein [Chitinophaga ginsengisegetis]